MTDPYADDVDWDALADQDIEPVEEYHQKSAAILSWADYQSFAITGSWPKRAACAKSDVRLFFAFGDHERHVVTKAREAACVVICSGCPVKQQCLEHAIRTEEPAGVWGGHTQEELQTLIKADQVNTTPLTAWSGWALLSKRQMECLQVWALHQDAPEGSQTAAAAALGTSMSSLNKSLHAIRKKMDRSDIADVLEIARLSGVIQ